MTAKHKACYAEGSARPSGRARIETRAITTNHGYLWVAPVLRGGRASRKGTGSHFLRAACRAFRKGSAREQSTGTFSFSGSH